jgi:ABC-type branched-subunit amino acid transport system ATPase component/branched-subunit amino acid ABC-type transport system permease component
MGVLSFGLIGLGAGGSYALIACALVAIYRGSGIVNFAQGALVLAAGYLFYSARVSWGLPTWLSVLFAVAAVTAVSVLIQVVVLQPMRTASALSRVIVTLAVLVTVQAIVFLIWSNQDLTVPSVLPTNPVPIGSGAFVGEDRLSLIAIGVVITLAMWALYRRTPFGRMTTAVAENPAVLACTGHSPDRIAAANWAIGGLLSGIAGVLISPITGLSSGDLSLAVLPALAAAAVGAFASFPVTLVASLAVGVAETEVLRYVSDPGWSESVPFILVIGYLVIRGRGLPLRSYVLERLPIVGKGRLRPIPVIGCSVAAYLLLGYVLQGYWAASFAVSVTMAIICLSTVIVTGYSGQISLSQYVLGGAAALMAAIIGRDLHWDLALLLVASFVASMVVGTILGIPALRTRGVNLAVVTLGASVVIYELILTASVAGGADGVLVPPPTFLGLDINPLFHATRYYMLCLTVFIVLAIVTANIRRSAFGRRMLAVRSSERAAVATGVNVFATKLFAFGLAAGFASLGATLLAFMNASIVASQFDVFTSILVMTSVVIGGVGLIPGAMVGGLLFSNGFGNQVLQSIGLSVWLPLIGGLSTLFVLRFGQDGIVEMNVRQARVVAAKARALAAGLVPRLNRKAAEVGAGPERGRARGAHAANLGEASVHVEPLPLRVTGLSVRFGGVRALNDVSLTIEPGRVHGLIGPNGAGKTTLVDAVTGFVAATGNIVLGDREISGHRPLRRAREGVGRSFQSVELFEDLSVLENICVAGDRRGPLSSLREAIWPRRLRVSGAGAAAVRTFALENYLDREISELPFGRRRLVSIARTVAAAPSVLMLDEPASGLDAEDRAEMSRLIRTIATDWGMAVLLIEHDVDLVWSVCDEVTVLVGGAVLESGPAGVIRDSARTREAYMGTVDDASRTA